MPSFLERFLDFHANLHPVVKWGGYLVLAAGLTVAGLPPAYRLAKSWRMEQNLEAAISAASAGQYTEARDRSLAVLRSKPDSLAAIRVFAEAVYSLKEPAAQEIACMMLVNPQGDESDKTRAFTILAERSPMALVGGAWIQIGKEAQKRLEYRLPFVRRLIQQSHFTEAAGLLQETPDAERPPELEAEWIGLLARMENDEYATMAQDRALRFFQENRAEAQAVLESLQRIRPEAIQSRTASAASEWLKRHPDARPTDHLAVARLRYACEPDRRGGIVAIATETWSEKAPAVLCNWLVALGRFDEADALKVPDHLADDPEWFDARAVLYQKSGRWKDWLKLLENPPAGMPRLELCADRAVAALKAGDQAKSGIEWTNAITEARADNTRNGFLILAAKAEAAGMQDEAIAAMSQAVRIGRGLIPVHERLKPLVTELAKRGRGKELLQIFSVLMQYEGANPIVVTNYCYLGGIYGVIEPDFIVKRMEELRKALPNAVPVRAVLAGGWLMKNEPAKAAEVMEMDGVDWKDAAPGYRAVYGTTMYLLGKEEESARVLQGMPWEELLPRETNVYIGMLSKARRASGTRDPLPWLPDFQPRAEVDASENLTTPTPSSPALPTGTAPAAPPPATQ